jgi:hypothetical protein
MNTSKISSRYIFVVCLLSLLSSARIDAGDSKLHPVYTQLGRLNPAFNEINQSCQQQPTVQFPATPMSSVNTSLLDLNPQQQPQQPAPISVGILLRPLQGIKFQKTQSAYVAEKNDIKVILDDDSHSYSQLTLYQDPTVIQSGGMVYGNESIKPDFVLSRYEDIDVTLTPLEASYNLENGGIVEVGQVPWNYFKAQQCDMTSTKGANTISLLFTQPNSSITHIDFSQNALKSWQDIQTNLLKYLPGLETLILDHNPLAGTCKLDHKKLRTLQASHTNTIGYDLMLPVAEKIDLSHGKIVWFDTAQIVCAPGAHINFSYNPCLKAIRGVFTINKSKLRCDFRGTQASIEDICEALPRIFKLRSLINPYVYRVSEMVRNGALQFAVLALFSVATNWSLHICKGARQQNGMLLLGVLPITLATAGSISLAQKLLGVATTPKTIVCNDGCIYASYTIEKNSEKQKELKALPWYFSAAQQ